VELASLALISCQTTSEWNRPPKREALNHPHRESNSESFPLGYLITFRAYGTWLHGDSQGSVDRFHNRYGTPRIPANRKCQKYNERTMKRPPVNLSKRRRADVEAAIRETCQYRNWTLWAVNVRTNHVHSVVSASCDPELVLSAFKANATRKMRTSGSWRSGETPMGRKR
jgi:hypothetical protein